MSAARRRAAVRLPGDPDPASEVARMIRVDQAGELGAARIYDGQLAILGHRRAGAPIREMRAQEQQHLDAFDRLIAARRVRPTVLSPLWDVAGFAIGAATALMGEHAAMACTVAVEEVIDQHYAGQVARLGDDERPLRDMIASFRDDEIAHRDTALRHSARQAPGYHALSAAIRAGTRTAIWLSTRL